MKHILFILFLTIFISSNAQKITRANLPFINIETIDEAAFDKGKLSVKVKRSLLNQFKFSVVNNTIQFSNVGLQNINLNYSFNKINNTFSLALQDESNYLKHIHYNLDLWFTIYFDETKNVKSLVKDLQKTLVFEAVEPSYKKILLDGNTGVNFLPNDPKLNEQWAFNNTGQADGVIGKDIKLPQALDIETGKPQVIVSVHDMGIQLNHPDLAQNILPNKSFNFIYNKDSIIPGYHGTRVSGIIGAVNNNNIGISSIAGGNGNANSGIRLMSCQVYDLKPFGMISDGFGPSFIYAADNGVAISNNSWAYGYDGTYELHVLDAIDYFVENGGGNVLQGGLVVFAAGNVSRNVVVLPSAYDRVIAVAATNNKDEKTIYSTYANWIDLSAPGGEYKIPPATQVLSTDINGTYTSDHGTSLSSPMVAGVAALIVSKGLGKFSASDVRDIIIISTDYIDEFNPNYLGFLGSGRLNAFKALQKTEQLLQTNALQNIDSLKVVNNCNTITVSWKNDLNKKVVLVYSNKNNIGLAINGTQFSVGNTFSKSSKVVYIGTGNSFSISNNDSLLHFFKAFVVDANNNYSLGKEVSIQTTPSNNINENLIQNFDYPVQQPTKEWRTVNTNNDIGWIHTVVDTANTGYKDLYSLCAYNYNYNQTQNSTSTLLSPICKSNVFDSITLSFWYAYQYRNSGFTSVDTFEVLITKDCGKTFTSLYKKAGLDLGTTAATTIDTAFYPFKESFWKPKNIGINNILPTDKIQFAFRIVNGKGNNLFLDNINISYYNKLKFDASLISIDNIIINNCSNIIEPKITLKNKGTTTIAQAEIVYKINNQTITTLLNTNLKTNEIGSFSLTRTNANYGNNNFRVYIKSIANNKDEYNINDTITSSFNVNNYTESSINEDFEANAITPKNWTINQIPVDEISWIIKKGIGKNSNQCLMMKNNGYNRKDRIDEIITPAYLLNRDYDSVSFYCDYAYAMRAPTDSNTFDTLQIDYSLDCGNTWTTIYKNAGKHLVSFNQTNNELYSFLPTQNQWKSIQTSITSNLKKNDWLQFKFKNHNRFGNNVYLDNVNIAATISPKNLQLNGYAIYPNPTKGEIFIQTSNTNSLKNIEVINVNGRVVKLFNNTNYSKDFKINLNELQSGVYFLRLYFLDKTVVEKVIKMP